MKKSTLLIVIILSLLIAACGPSAVSRSNERLGEADRLSDHALANTLQTALDLYLIGADSAPTTFADFCTQDYLDAATLAKLPTGLNTVQLQGKVSMIIFDPDALTVTAVNP